MKHSETGCKQLDNKGITQGELSAGTSLCLSCPDAECCLDRNNTSRELTRKVESRVVSVHCHMCHNTEDITIVNGILHEQKWSMNRDTGQVYHEPCGALCDVYHGKKVELKGGV